MNKAKELEVLIVGLEALQKIYKLKGGIAEIQSDFIVGESSVKVYIYAAEGEGIKKRFDVRVEGINLDDPHPAVEFDLAAGDDINSVIREVRAREGI